MQMFNNTGYQIDFVREIDLIARVVEHLQGEVPGAAIQPQSGRGGVHDIAGNDLAGSPHLQTRGTGKLRGRQIMAAGARVDQHSPSGNRSRRDLASIQRAIAVYAPQRVQERINVRKVTVAVVSAGGLDLHSPAAVLVEHHLY